MLINNINISEFGVLAADRDIQLAEVTTYDDWLRKGSAPIINYQKEYYRKIKCKFFLRAQNYQQILNNISDLSNQLKKCTIKFDDIDFYYDCTLQSSNIVHHNVTEKTLEVELKCGYAYKAVVTETINSQAQKTINVLGNLPSPAIITVNMPVDTISITISGFEDSITVKNLHANTPVKIDGEQCLVTEGANNKFSSMDMWNFPVLQPGGNTISLDNSNGNITIQYKPRWL